MARQPQRDFEHDVALPIRALEAAVPIAEGTVFRGEGPALARRAIETGDAHQRLGDFLAVRAHVLNRRAADRPRHARQALAAGPAALRHALHYSVPIDAGASADVGAGPVAELDPADGDAQDESGET